LCRKRFPVEGTYDWRISTGTFQGLKYVTIMSTGRVITRPRWATTTVVRLLLKRASEFPTAVRFGVGPVYV
jgi:hypothetical protein